MIASQIEYRDVPASVFFILFAGLTDYVARP